MSRFRLMTGYRLVILAALVASAFGLMVQPAQAQSVKETTALKLVPGDAAFFVSSMRLGEIYSKVANSRAIAKLKEIPAVQMGLFMAMSQWENPQDPQIAAFKQALQSPENQDLVALLQDAVSNEVFFYGDSSFGPAMQLFSDINSANQAAQFEAMAAGEMHKLQEYQLGKILEVLTADGLVMEIPNSVIGFRVTDAQRADGQLQRLAALAKGILGKNPQLAEKISEETLAGGKFLTLRLDGTMLPWPMIMAQAGDIDQEKLQPIIDKVSAMTFVISIGRTGDYVLLSIGKDNKNLASLGQGDLLADRPEMAPIVQAGGKRLTGVSFVSAEFMQLVGSVERQVDQFRSMIKGLLPMAPISIDLQDEMMADVDKFAEYVKQKAPEQSAMSGYSYLTDDGFESFGYRWSTESLLDPSKNLSILSHLGGNPLAFFAAREKSDPETYDEIATGIGRIVYYAEQFGLQNVGPDEKAGYQKLRETLKPLFERAGTVTRDKLIPALADGQSALVLDAKSTSIAWHQMMPPSDNPLPMFEFGIVAGVSDAEALKSAFSDYFDILQETLDTLHEASTGDLKDFFPDEIPPIKLARPQTREVGAGTIYYYSLPAETGLDAQIAPNGGLSDDFVGLSLMPRFTRRLLEDNALQGTGPLADVNRPLAAATYLNFAGILEAIDPWITYGMQLSGQFNTSTQPGGPVGGIAEQVQDVLEVLKCFRSISVVAYAEDGAIVTHSHCIIQDVQ